MWQLICTKEPAVRDNVFPNSCSECELAIICEAIFLYNTKLEFSDLEPKFPIDYQVALIKKMGVPFDHVAPVIYISDLAKQEGAKHLLARKWNERRR